MRSRPKHKRDAARPHSPEPWAAHPIADTVLASDLQQVATFHDSAGKRLENRERVIACVNACAEIDSKVLSSLPAGSLARLIDDYKAVKTELSEIVDALTSVRLKAKVRALLAKISHH